MKGQQSIVVTDAVVHRVVGDDRACLNRHRDANVALESGDYHG